MVENILSVVFATFLLAYRTIEAIVNGLANLFVTAVGA